MKFNIKNLEKLTLDRAIVYQCYQAHCFDDVDVSYKLFNLAVAIEELKENIEKYNRVLTWDIFRATEVLKPVEVQNLFNEKEFTEFNHLLSILKTISNSKTDEEQKMLLANQLDDNFVQKLYQTSEQYFSQNKDKMNFEKESEVFSDFSDDEEFLNNIISTTIKNVEASVLELKGENTDFDFDKEIETQIRYSLHDIYDEEIDDEYSSLKNNNAKTIFSFFEEVLKLFDNDVEKTIPFIQKMMIDKNNNKVIPDEIEELIIDTLKNQDDFEKIMNNDFIYLHFYNAELITDYFVNDNFYLNLNDIVNEIKNQIEPISISNVNYHEMNHDLGNIHSLNQTVFYDLLNGIVYGFENQAEYQEIKANFEELLQENQEEFNSGIINFLNQCGVSLEDLKEKDKFIDENKKDILKSIVEAMDNSTCKNCQAFTYLTNMTNEDIIKTKVINNIKTSFSIPKDEKEMILSSLPEVQITLPRGIEYGIVNPVLGSGYMEFLTPKDIVLNAEDCEIMHGFHKYDYNSYRHTANDIFLLTRNAFKYTAKSMIINEETQELKVNQVFDITKMDGNKKQLNLDLYLEHKIDSKLSNNSVEKLKI